MSNWVARSLIILAALLITTVNAAEDDEEEEVDFDDVEERAPHTLKSWSDRIHLSGRFDFNLEMENLGGDGAKPDRFRTYHHFIFLKADISKKLLLEAELIDQVYYEMTYRLTDGVELKAGKIWVPFGLSPFHHYYGGVQGDPFTGKLLPNVWAELGASIRYPILKDWRGLSVFGDSYIVRGFEEASGRVLALNAGGSDDVFAYGQRLTIKTLKDRLTVAGSALYNKWGTDNDQEVFLWGGDFSTAYGLLKAPGIRHLRFSGAAARAEIRDRTLVESANNDQGWYYKYGDFVEVHYGRWQPDLTFRVRYGSYIDFDDVVTNNDTHSINVAAIRRMGPLVVIAEHFWNFEEVDEVPNDLFRLHAVVEF